jgi:hypothetical protein
MFYSKLRTIETYLSIWWCCICRLKLGFSVNTKICLWRKVPAAAVRSRACRWNDDLSYLGPWMARCSSTSQTTRPAGIHTQV